jgi:hypothetical protein
MADTAPSDEQKARANQLREQIAKLKGGGKGPAPAKPSNPKEFIEQQMEERAKKQSKK